MALWLIVKRYIAYLHEISLARPSATKSESTTARWAAMLAHFCWAWLKKNLTDSSLQVAWFLQVDLKFIIEVLINSWKSYLKHLLPWRYHEGSHCNSLAPASSTTPIRMSATCIPERKYCYKHVYTLNTKKENQTRFLPDWMECDIIIRLLVHVTVERRLVDKLLECCFIPPSCQCCKPCNHSSPVWVSNQLVKINEDGPCTGFILLIRLILLAAECTESWVKGYIL